jgi:hypothetical protein
VYGSDPSARIAFGLASKIFCFTRAGAVARPLYRRDGDEFYPAGAESVRIRFAEANGEMTLQVYDPDLVLSARRTN